jgi:pseudaminic acid synthase
MNEQPAPHPTTNTVSLGGRMIGVGFPCYIVAEMSANHLGCYDRAEAIVRAAAEAGADAIKLQTYTPDTMTLDLPGKDFEASSPLWKGRRLYDLYREAMTPWEWHQPLKNLATSLGLDLFSSPFDEMAVEFLQNLGVPAMKIASFEMIDHCLIKSCASTGLPLIMSTGMATADEVSESVGVARLSGCRDVILLKCTSCYPARYEDMNLRTIDDMIRRFEVPVGLSDHSPGSVIPVAAVAQGACMIEKHLTLSRKDGGPDAVFSLEPGEFRKLVEDVKIAESALGTVTYGKTEQEWSAKRSRRSLYVVEDVLAGELVTGTNVRSIRPGHGLPPKLHASIQGKVFVRDTKRGTPLSLDLLA